MKTALKWTLRVALLLLIIAVGVAGYFLLIDGRPPAKRPDLVRLPEGTPEAPRGYPTFNAAILAYLLGTLEIIDIYGEIPVPEGVVEELGVEYGRVGDTPLLLNLYRPEKIDDARPALIFIHGGGWSKGDRNDYKYYTVRFAAEGYVVATISYRFIPKVKYPGCISDAKCAVRWMRANAEKLQIDPERIAVIGGSAGGHLSLMTGYSSDVPELEGDGGHEGVSSRVAAVIDLYGPVDLTTEYARTSGPVTDFIGKSYEEAPELYEMASPIHHLDANDPPTLVIQGTTDALVPVRQSDWLVERLKELGIPYYYARVDGWPHTLDATPEVNVYVMGIMKAFLEEFLG